ncbi:hypothetical protein B0T18DRAFT_326827 [Schizothecium vesticola]|uniref:SAP domain-containing protein n=1 Tax=Schizothecium vesticola TaxID=314040 RepID=A0AA40EVX0_9PEZI|nr:hypothetical protein B0T18DRAFT_326827 [Schizothecium vesticola]
MAADWSKLTVVDLRQELKRRGLPQTGKKADLVERLETDDNEAPARSESPIKQTGQAEDAEEAEAAPQLQPPSVDAEAPSPPPSEPLLPTATSDGSQIPQEKALSPAPAELPTFAVAVSVTELVQDIQDIKSRKRRSRSPPPDDDLGRKRARADSDNAGGDRIPSRDDHMALDNALKPSTLSDATRQPQAHEASHARDEPRAQTDHSVNMHRGEKQKPGRYDDFGHGERRERETPGPSYGDYGDKMDEDDRDIEPAVHPATSALYIKNFMRPLRDSTLREHLIDLAAPRGNAATPNALIDCHLDHLRTHAFVRFDTVAAASRVRTALHGRVWPDERNRQQLWVDFIPPSMALEWADRELGEGSKRNSRWEVRYDVGDDGHAVAKHVNLDAEPAAPPPRSQLAPPQTFPGPVPTGPSRPFAGVEGAPSGPRGRGRDSFRQQSFPTPIGDNRETRTHPPLRWRPVPDELADQRIENMRFFYTKDRHRDMGAPNEINRYTFENQHVFVDRGEENFVGIRPPHRQREIDLARRGYAPSAGDRGPPRGPAPSFSRGDRYIGGSSSSRGGGGRDFSGRRDFLSGRDEWTRGEEVPRSRFDGAPLPTFHGGGGGGGGGGRGGRRGFRGGRR